MSDKPTSVPIKDLRSEDDASELANSPAMEPYLRLAMAGLQRQDIAPSLKQIAELPLDQRYIWRVASALKWAFADFDSVNVVVDRETLSPEDLAKVIDLVKLRPVPFCMFLSALVGADAMEHLMTEAVSLAKQQG